MTTDPTETARSLTDDHRFLTRVLELFSASHADAYGDLFWRVDDHQPTLYANVSDVFAWGGADCEPITPQTLTVLEQAYADLKAVGAEEFTAELYAARQRGMRPQGAAYPGAAHESWRRVAALYDSCGPERAVGFGNPKPAPDPAAAGPAPATDQAARRELYAAAISETDGWVLDGGQHMIDAVMAVADTEQAGLREALSDQPAAEAQEPPTGRAAVLREAADRFDGWVRPPSSPDRFAAGVRWVTVSLRRMADETPQPEADLPTLAAALDGIHTLIATSSRDWQTYRVDAWLWAVLCGWDCEQAVHDETCTHGALEETAAMHGWDAATVAKARRYRAAVRTLTTAAPAVAQPDEEADAL